MQFDFKREPGRFLMNRPQVSFDKPLVSVITPFYNAGKYFEQTYNSVLNQTFPWFEWIIVNDGSTDEASVKLMKELAAKDKRIRTFSQENGGAVKARKLGVTESRSDIVIFLDADDLAEKRWVECLYWALVRNPDAAWAYSDSLGFDGNEYLWDRAFSSTIEKSRNILIYAAAIRKMVFEKYPNVYADDTRNNYEDWQLWLKLLAQGQYPAHVQGFLFWYRRLESGELSRINNDKELKKTLLNQIEELAKNVSDGISAVEINGRTSTDFAHPQLFDFNYEDYSVESVKTRLLVLIPHVVHGGADWFNIQIAKNIDKEKYVLSVICTGFGDNDDWLQELAEYCEDLYVLREFLSLHDWPGFIHYYIKTRNVDIVWNISSYYGYYLLPWLRKEFPNLAIGNYVHADAAYWRSGGYARLSAAFREMTELTVTTNRETLNIMREKYNLSDTPTEVSYIGTDVDYYNPDIISTGKIRSQYNIPKDAPVILYLCRISGEKRPFLMLYAAEKLIKLLPETHVLVVGDGDKLKASKELAKQLKIEKNTIFCGTVDDTRAYYQDANMLLICSLKEGLAQTTFEAMSMGLPVVSSDVGGQRELVNEKTGALIKCRQDETDFEAITYNPVEIDELAGALYRFASDLVHCAKVGEANRKLIFEKYSTKRAAQDMERYSQFLLADSAVLERRKQLSQKLRNEFPALADEMVTVYGSLEKLQQDSNEIYQSLNSIQGGTFSKADSVEMLYFYYGILTKTAIGRFMMRVARRFFRFIKEAKKSEKEGV